MGTQVHAGNYPKNITLGMSVGGDPAETIATEKGASQEELLPAADSNCKSEVRQVLAHSLEFVALPGEPKKLQRELPIVLREATRHCEGFNGCMVFFSEQEARLVTVVTLWANSASVSGYNEKSVRSLLAPYVDRWLRAGRFVTFVFPGELTISPGAMLKLNSPECASPLGN